MEQVRKTLAKINLDYIIKHRYLIFGLLFLVFVLFKLHFSSIGMWDKVLTEKIDKASSTNLLGVSRPLRSDEWLVQTPLFIGQANSKPAFPVRNNNISSIGQNAIISYGAPTLDLTLVGKPFNWGFILLGDEYGLSWYWCMKLFLLFLLSFEVAMLLTKRKTGYSILGAMLVTFASAVQWWFSTSLVDMLVFAQGIIVIFNLYFKAQSKYFKVLLGILMIICLNGFALTLYPAWQVPIAYLVAIFCVTILINHKKNDCLKIGALDIGVFAGVLVVTGAVLFHFYTVSKDDIKLMMDTVYPGKRFVIGGGYEILELQLYTIGWLLPLKNITFSNNCEVSSFVNFAPLVIVSIYTLLKREKENRLLIILLTVFYFLQLFWMTIPTNSFIAKITFMSYVPVTRLQVIANLTGLYLTIWAIPKFLEDKDIIFTDFQKVILTTFTSALIVVSILFTSANGYLNTYTFLITLTLFMLMNTALVYRYKRTFIIVCMFVTIVTGAFINPLSRGLGSIYNKTISQKIIEINREDTGKTWASIDSIYTGNLLIALGCKAFNGVNYYPDFNKLNRLDPAKKFMDVYNRYAHIIVRLQKKGDINFRLSSPDTYAITLTPETIKNNTDIKYILSEKGLESHSDINASFVKVFEEENGNLAIYKVE